MPCVRIPNGIVCYNNCYQIKVKGRTVIFEWHSYFGPWPLRKDGCPVKRVSSAFWKAVTPWIKKHVNKDHKVVGIEPL